MVASMKSPHGSVVIIPHTPAGFPVLLGEAAGKSASPIAHTPRPPPPRDISCSRNVPRARLQLKWCGRILDARCALGWSQFPFLTALCSNPSKPEKVTLQWNCGLNYILSLSHNRQQIGRNSKIGNFMLVGLSVQSSHHSLTLPGLIFSYR